MVKIRPSSEIDKAYKDSIGRVPGRYKDAVGRVTDWQEKAGSDAAETLYAAKVQEAIASRRRQKATQKTSNEEWRAAASNVGAQRIGAGMQANADKRTRNFEPFRNAIEGASLPDRTADPMQNIDNRVKGMVKVLVDTKKQIKG